MADITKKVDRGIFPTSRTQNFTEADAGAGDVLMVEQSLGHVARHVVIETDALLELRLNVYRKAYPRRAPFGDGLTDIDHLPNVAAGVDITDDTGALISIEGGTTYELDNDVPVRDIQLLAVSGNFDIFVS